MTLKPNYFYHITETPELRELNEHIYDIKLKYAREITSVRILTKSSYPIVTEKDILVHRLKVAGTQF